MPFLFILNSTVISIIILLLIFIVLKIVQVHGAHLDFTVCVLTAYLVPWVGFTVHILPKSLLVHMWSTVLYVNEWPFVVAHGIHLDPVPYPYG